MSSADIPTTGGRGELLHLDHSKEMQERLAAIMRCLEKSRKPENRSMATMLQKAINNSNNNEGRDRTWNHLRENSLSDTFRTEAVRWYEEGRVQGLLDGLPECYRKAYRDPRKLLGQAHYRGLSHEKLMQLLSFAAAMALIEEWREEEKKNVQIFQKESNPTVNFY